MRILAFAAAALTAALTFGGAVAAQPARAGSETREFQAWTVVCNNVNDCVAYSQGDDFGPGWAMIRMDAGPNAEPEVLFGDWPEEGAAPIAARIDGEALRTELVMPDRYYTRAVEPRAALAAMAAGDRLVLTLQGAEHDPGGVPVALAGVSATLLWIDERQGRLNTRSALIRRGDRPNSGVPAAWPTPEVHAGPAIGQAGLPASPPDALEALPAVQSCDEETAFHQSDLLVRREVARLSDDTLLWSVLCSLGAYNQGNRFFLTDADGANPRPLRLPETPQPWHDDMTEADRLTYINAGYDVETRTLTTFAKARGLGDCGLFATWIWTGDQFLLVEERVMNVCAGIGHDLWPQTWVSSTSAG